MWNEEKKNEFKLFASRYYNRDWSKLEEEYGIGLHGYLKEKGVELPKSGVYVEKNKSGVITLMAAVQDHKLLGPYERYDDNGELVEEGQYDEEGHLDERVTAYSVAKVGCFGRDFDEASYSVKAWDCTKAKRYERLSISLKHGIPDGTWISRKPDTHGDYEKIWGGKDSVGASSTEIKTFQYLEYKNGKIWTNDDGEKLRWSARDETIYVREGKLMTEDEFEEEKRQANLRKKLQEERRAEQEKIGAERKAEQKRIKRIKEFEARAKNAAEKYRKETTESKKAGKSKLIEKLKACIKGTLSSPKGKRPPVNGGNEGM